MKMPEKLLFESMLFFFNLFHFSLVLMPTARHWGVKCIIPTSAVKVGKYANLLQYCQVI